MAQDWIGARAWRAATDKRHFWRRVIQYGFLERSSRPAEWLRFRHGVSRLLTTREADSGPLLSLSLGELFPRADATFAGVALLAPSPYGVSWEELVVLSAIVKTTSPQVIVEFGTFDGRTTAHLAANAKKSGTVHSFDIQAGRFDFGADAPYFEAREVGQYVLGREFPARVVLHTCDTRRFDWSAFEGKVDLIFVDGDHSYATVMSDSAVARRLTAPRGVVLWHDYGVVEDVTRALVELSGQVELRHIKGTSLVLWRNDKGA